MCVYARARACVYVFMRERTNERTALFAKATGLLQPNKITDPRFELPFDGA